MLDRPLLNLFPESKKEIGRNVLFQWFGLLLNIAITLLICTLIFSFYDEKLGLSFLPQTWCSGLLVAFLCLKFFVTLKAGEKAFRSSANVKSVLREKIYNKLVKQGGKIPEESSLAEILQLLVEGIEQLELYFSGYVPQLFYSLIAPITLFCVVATIDIQVAFVLFLCVPLIPICIVVVQKLAKKLFHKYWGEYTSLGDLFLENLQGLTTLKIYQADGDKAKDMNQSAEQFRKITMSVLKSQLNSIVVMDIVAYGGAAIGMILASLHLSTGKINPWDATVIILLSAEFFLPMRRLGSFFHVSMNGMAASKKIFALLSAPEPESGYLDFTNPYGEIVVSNLTFSYNSKHASISNINLNVSHGQLICVVGKSGSGKSTLVKLLQKEFVFNQGSITVGGQDIRTIKNEQLSKHITYIPYQSYIFSGTIRDNLALAKENATEHELFDVLKKVNLIEFAQENKGLETEILESGSNLSGGQKQRLALAMAILRDSAIYIFDEATSQVDEESESIMIDQIYRLAEKSTVILISHSLRNCVNSHCIYVMDAGKCVQTGTHEHLIVENGSYQTLWNSQEELVHYEK